MKFMFSVSALLFPIIGMAGDFAQLMKPFDRIIFNLNYGKIAMGVQGSGKESQPNECLNGFVRAMDSWKKAAAKNGELAQVQGWLKRPFSKHQILSMPSENPHGLRGVIRGTSELLPDPASLGGAPDFPHAVAGCEKMFDEEVRIDRSQGKACRVIKLTLKGHPTASYFQTYCANSTDLLINFHPQNLRHLSETSDAKTCD